MDGNSMMNRKRNNRRVSEQLGSRWKLPMLPWRRIGVVAGVCAALLCGSWGVMHALDQPVTQVSVRGHFQRVSAVDVEDTVRSRLTGAGLLSINLGALRNGLRSLPWIDSATVERSWPRGLIITVVEQNAVARWNGSGLVNARGELFVKDTQYLPPELPSLQGPMGTEAEVTSRYLAMQGKLVEAGLRLASLARDERGAWQLDLDNGVSVRLGRRDVDMRFARFLDVGAALLAQRGADIAYMDMRYSNGFAVGWRNAAPRLAGTTSGDEHPHG